MSQLDLFDAIRPLNEPVFELDLALPPVELDDKPNFDIDVVEPADGCSNRGCGNPLPQDVIVFLERDFCSIACVMQSNKRDRKPGAISVRRTKSGSR